MTNAEKLNPMPNPMAGQENSDVPLEKIVGKLPPELEKYRDYLKRVLHYRQLWSETGDYPVDEAGDRLDKLRDGISQREVRRILDKQLNKICLAFPIPSGTEIEPGVREKAFGVYGEVKSGELEVEHTKTR